MVGTSGRLDYWSQQVVRRSSCNDERPVTSLMEKIRWNLSNCCRGNTRLLNRFSAGDLECENKNRNGALPHYPIIGANGL